MNCVLLLWLCVLLYQRKLLLLIEFIDNNNINKEVVAGSESSWRCSLVTRRPRYDSTTGSLRMKAEAARG